MHCLLPHHPPISSPHPSPISPGLYPDTWPLPLTRAGLDNAKKNPVRQAMPPLPAGHSERAKRKADRDGTPGVGRRASGGGGKRGVVDLDGDAGTPTVCVVGGVCGGWVGECVGIGLWIQLCVYVHVLMAVLPLGLEEHPSITLFHVASSTTLTTTGSSSQTQGPS